MWVQWSARRELVLALMAGSLLVVARSAVFVLYPQSYFDSDQAIFGLMAKHWIEGRAFPLFPYGQGYLLAVDSWLLAPVFLVFGPTVTAMHSTMLVVNLVVVNLLVAGLVRWCRIRPFQALAASLFLTFAPPLTSAWITANHGNIWPFFYVLIVWMVRDRPLWLGLVLGLGGLHREFTFFAVPVLLFGQLITGTLFRWRTIRGWLATATVVVALSLAVRLLIPHADLLGPGTKGQPLTGPANTMLENLKTHTNFLPEQWIARSNWMLRMYLPRQLGARPIPASSLGENAVAFPQGRNWMFWLLMPTLGLVFLRDLQLSWTARRSGAVPAFGWYLFGLGLVTVVNYVMTVSLSSYAIDRYLFLSIYGAVGTLALFFALEPWIWAKRAVYAVLIIWACVSATDHTTVALQYWRGEPDDMQELADGLVARGIHSAQADYWVSYKLSFVARERVKVGADDYRRINEYEDLLQREGAKLYHLRLTPCVSDQPPIGHWNLCHQ